jgi:hypothetical protein
VAARADEHLDDRLAWCRPTTARFGETFEDRVDRRRSCGHGHLRIYRKNGDR